MKPPFLVFLLLSFFTCFPQAQDIPPISIYTSNDYQGANQNWMIDQGSDLTMYIANNNGLMVYNGASWKTYPSPNSSILRSVKVVGERIYTGCYMEFGYWEKDLKQQLNYTSIAQSFPDMILEDEQIWNIMSLNKWILFQSLNQIFIYDSDNQTLRSVGAANGITRMFMAGDSVYFHSYGEGIYKIEKGQPQLLIGDQSIANSRIVNIYEKANKLVILSQENGFFNFDLLTGEISAIDQNKEVAISRIYSSLILRNGNIALGTISRGIIIVDREWKLVYHIDQSKGLSNNTVLNLFEDEERNLWMALDNGINCLNLSSPLRNFYDQKGNLGTVYASAIKDNLLYVGTNQGLFCRPVDGSLPFSLIPGTKSQVWALFEYDGKLFCGHDSGTFLVKDETAELICNIPGTWSFRVHPQYPDTIIQGSYTGFNILKKTNGNWRFSHRIEGFNYSSKHFEITDDLVIYMSHEYKGVFELELDDDLTHFKSFKKLKNPERGKNSGIAKLNNQIIYAYEKGIYRLNDSKEDAFHKDTILSAILHTDQYISGKLIEDTNNDLWLFTEHNLNRISPGKLSNKPEVKKIPIPYNQVRSMAGYENLTAIKEDKYLIGAKDGYLTIDLKDLQQRDYEISINKAYSYQFEEKDSLLDLDAKGHLNYQKNSVAFEYHIPEYQKYTEASYQYQLAGMYNKWSNWSEKPSVSFENLPFGDYTFKVRGRIGNQPTTNTASFQFTVLRPWYLSNSALIVYALLLIIFSTLINLTYKKYYHRQQSKLILENEKKLKLQQLESEQEMVKLRNDKLRQDVDNKNRELAASTMSIIKKNEFLIEIRDLLKAADKNNDPGIKSIIRNINDDIDEEDNWNLFKDAFNNADKDFLKKIKDAHPNLTPNDLRLCAYLRLNLSSKEIAPLLNISVRSVEIKRYRLRKKIQLEHEKGLVEYILSI